ncbi:protein RTF2 homolog [Phalaenopsis equestris]|uniref:protein RTF2 homolog n=1 Tax=Phalaenopsis equestris TaxID=78828 RepID=UPI0009E64708|nr:protein RTF2 homolog [Phalaenopsis equestris]
MASSKKMLQIFVASPDLGLPSRSLTLSPYLTLHSLKLSLFPSQNLTQTLNCLYFSLNGKPLLDSSTLSSADVKPSSLLTLRLRFSGGGGDGGATGAESRDCYLNMYAVKKPDKVDPNETRLSRWTTCAFSSEPLAPPCVIDRIGNIFNKESLVEALIHKRLPKEFSHIRRLKDMIPVHLSPIPDAGRQEMRFQCPISGLEFNGKYGFVAIKGCGHVLSGKALKEVKTSACLVCHKEFSELDKIVINGTLEEVALLRERMEEERGRSREKMEKNVGCSLSGAKHGVGETAGSLECVGKDRSAKRFKAVDIAPVNATKEVYASIFTSSKKTEFKETYSCRSLPLGRN